MNCTVRYALAVVLLAAAFGVPLRAAEEPELGGMYASRGMNPDGTEYRGLVRIVKRGGSFVVSWMFPLVSNGSVVFEPSSVGIGLASTGTLAVSYFGGRMAGVVLYRIEENGQRLNGQWAVAGDDGAVYSETLTKLSAEHEPPTSEPAPTPEKPKRNEPPAPPPPGSRSL